jgi:hypothetical protein
MLVNKRYPKQSILTHHGLSDKTRLILITPLRIPLYFLGDIIWFILKINLSNITILIACINLKPQIMKITVSFNK